ncbi:hypothetical protein GCM10027610_048480 [Dactylosporangium cerinum]
MVLVVVALAVGGCGDATGDPPSAATEQFTQGGVSMEPAVKAGQVITVRKTGADYQPKRGDVVVFHGDQAHWVGTSSPLLKRVVAVGGETVACCTVAGKVTVDGEPIDEPYVAEDAALEVPRTRAPASRAGSGRSWCRRTPCSSWATTGPGRTTHGAPGRCRSRPCSG